MRKIVKFGNNALCVSRKLNVLCMQNSAPLTNLVQTRSYSAGSGDSFLTGTSANFFEALYNDWLSNPKSVHPTWDKYFREESSNSSGSKAESVDEKSIEAHLAIQAIIRSYQVRGHLIAKISPLKNMDADSSTPISPPPDVLTLFKWVSENTSMDAMFKLPQTTKIGGKEKYLSIKEILRRLEATYCRHIGVEYMHITNVEECDWIREKFETPNNFNLTKAEKQLLLKRLGRATWIENFFKRKWPQEKRFGVEGCEVVVPCLKFIIDKSSELGTDMIIIGMAHRARINVLANVCRKPLYQIFTQFMGLEPEDRGSGDIKYHLGTYIERNNRVTNKKIAIALQPNPSHLEIVHPVTVGRARAEQFYKGDTKGDKVLPIVLHGDAAFCGQGVCFETIHFSNLPNYTTHGTIHVVVNNQVGFTTDPKFARSSPYATDVGRVINAPIFHVNSDDPESVVQVSTVAAEWRNKFHKDVIIDLVGYRRYGHSEDDEPTFTQPIMYSKIRKMRTNFEKYREEKIKEGVTTTKEAEGYEKYYERLCDEGMAKANKQEFMKIKDWLDSPWPDLKKDRDGLKMDSTGIKEDILTHIGTKLSTPPPNFDVHPGVLRVLKGRMGLLKERTCDWALGEAMAIGSLVKDGIHVRLSGEDVGRGTFSHRHHVLHHQSKEEVTYQYFNDLFPNQASYHTCNSPISEFGILAFELGFSTANPKSLVIWEAQYGDFADVAQAVIDTFIASGESKWARPSGLVCFLPHGLEGGGPEHSSARVERFLIMSSDDQDYFPPESPDFEVLQLKQNNWIVANCTTPANLFHILRRQVALPFRKPLMLMAPKSLLRHHGARSSFDDMLPGTKFKRIIPDEGPASKNPEHVKKVIFCSGKIYFDFLEAVKKKNCEDKIALTRVEQVCPFPFDLVKKECEKYPNAQIVWGQEEHKNSGCWIYIQPRFETALNGERDIIYCGRPVSPSPASGIKIHYRKELDLLLDDITKTCD